MQSFCFYLHSSMVRLEIQNSVVLQLAYGIFTFQYGQIRNPFLMMSKGLGLNIYIPVWLDQKFLSSYYCIYSFINLHSSMVRLEIDKRLTDFQRILLFTFQYGQIRNKPIDNYEIWFTRIYIPVWLDQKFYILKHFYLCLKDLHSSMVRLEMPSLVIPNIFLSAFTFQYGQIRNSK